MPKNTRFEVYPVDDPQNLPIKILPYLGNGDIFILGDIEPEHIRDLVDVQTQQRESGLYEAHVNLGVWEDSGYANRLDRQLLISTMGLKDELKKKSFYVFNPLNVRLYEFTEDMLEEYATDYFLGVARWRGINRIIFEHNLSPNDMQRIEKQKSKVRTHYNGLKKFPEPKKFGFGISRIADTQIGNLDYDISVKI